MTLPEPWLWVPVVLFAALAQTARNTAQRGLVAELGTLGATLVRFLYGLPFALLYLALLHALGGARWPQLSAAWLGWIAFGACFQVAATAALLLAMRARNFAVAVVWSKTEVLQIALFAAVLLHELPSRAALAAMLLASLGVVALSWPGRPAAGTGGPRAWCGQATLYGLLCGACFALASIGFRAAALEWGRLDGGAAPSAWLSGAWGVLLAQTLQSLGLGAWMAWTDAAKLRAMARAWRASLLAGSMGAAASLAWFSAYALQDIAQVRTLGMVEVLFSWLVSRRLLRERLSRREQCGMLLMLAGLVLACWTQA